MPETYFTLRWPDGRDERCYSPSTVITEVFEAGKTYPMDEFLSRARIGLERASDRVARKYGYACSSAMAQLDTIETRAATFAGQADAKVTCLKISQ